MPAMPQNPLITNHLDSAKIIQKAITRSKTLIALFEAYLDRLKNGLEPGSELDAIAAVKGITIDAAKARYGEKSGAESSGRSATKRLRDELRSFNSSPLARKLPIRLEVPPGVYGLKCEPQSPSLKRFWRPYLELGDKPDKKVFLVYTEHQFFAHPTDEYIVRHRDANQGDIDIQTLMPFLPEKHREKLIPVRQFVNSGDVHGLVRLSSLFGSMLIPVEHLPAHTTRLSKLLKGSNIIVIGNSRSCPFISKMQNVLGFAFRCHNDGIHVEGPRQRERDFYPTPYKGSEILYGTVSRVTIEPLDAVATAIVSNHGWFVSAMAYTLTQEANMERFLTRLAFKGSSLMPNRFEAIVGISPSEEDDSEMIGHDFQVLATRTEPR